MFEQRATRREKRRGVWRLIVQVTEEASEKPHGGHPDTYNAMMQDMAIGKEQALARRKDILQWNCGERHEVLGG